MPRPLRIHYEGAWYHVMNRGAGRQRIFNSQTHRHFFLLLLEQASSMFDIEVHAYCLMGNHYHLLIRTPSANLSRAMRHINGLYTQQYNRVKQTDGPLFRGRYKSILVEDDNYLLSVSRYIHLNPVEAKLVFKAEHYQWSSYQYYLNQNNKPGWLVTDNLQTQISSRIRLKPLKNYQAFVEMGNPRDVLDFYSQKHVSPIFGTESFKKKMLATVDDKKKAASSPDIRRAVTKPELGKILEYVAKHYKLQYKILFVSQRGQLNWPRLAAIFIARKHFGYSLSEIAHAFQSISKSTASSALQSVTQRLQAKPELREELMAIVQFINSQHDT